MKKIVKKNLKKSTKPKKQIRLGEQYILDFYGCPESTINDNKKIHETMIKAAEVAEATIVLADFHYFEPYGVSGVVVIQESHFAIHTWPEYGYAAIDVFTCGDIKLKAAIDFLKKQFKPKKVKQERAKRGNLVLAKRIQNLKIKR